MCFYITIVSVLAGQCLSGEGQPTTASQYLSGEGQPTTTSQCLSGEGRRRRYPASVGRGPADNCVPVSVRRRQPTTASQCCREREGQPDKSIPVSVWRGPTNNLILVSVWRGPADDCAPVSVRRGQPTLASQCLSTARWCARWPAGHSSTARGSWSSLIII